MEKEALEVPSVLKKQFSENQTIIKSLIQRLKTNPPPFVLTVARGSSDHAATFAKYLFETRGKLVTASLPPSVVNLYNADLNVKNALAITISQSGQSPDLVETIKVLRQQGAITVGLINDIHSPLAQSVEYLIPIWAGEEKAVAATKSYLGTLGALIQLISFFTDDFLLQSLLPQLIDELQLAATLDWSPLIDIYVRNRNTYVIGRGYSFPLAQEAALKFKETANIHAESFSSAEVLHGPFALIKKEFPVLMFGQEDTTLPGILELAKRLKKLGAQVMLAIPTLRPLHDYASLVLPLPNSIHPICDPLLAIQAFYKMAARLSIACGLNPDKPTLLSKVTQTW